MKAGETLTTTDQYGHFEIRNAAVVKMAAVVTVVKAGFFKGIKTYIAVEGKGAFFRIKLIPKITAGTINASSGGNVTLSNGVIIALPANAVVNAATNAIYAGPVNVAASWINPLAEDLNERMPGDLRGTDEAGVIKKLTTYGMAAIELTDASGQLLQVASGKKATLTMPLPASLSSSAPSTIPLWYFDENTGFWKEEGSAIKTGNTYVGEVSHFSYWNCDTPNSYIRFNCTVVNTAGEPIPYALVKVSIAGTQTAGWGYTDSSGYTGGAIPDNAQLVLEIFGDYGCGNVIYSQNFTTTNTDISLGTITVNTSYNATITGTATDCNNNPLASGYIIMHRDSQYTRYNITNGAYHFTTLLCSLPGNVNFIAEDIAGAQQSLPLNFVLSGGANVIGNLQACGLSTAEFFNYTINGTGYTFTSPPDTVYHSNYSGNTLSYVGAINTTNHYTYISFINAGIGLNSLQNLQTFVSTDIPDSAHITTPVTVLITEYGAVGQFISGSFSGALTGNPPANTVYNMTCNFRVRRNF